jgi:hypothetical protein
MGPGKEVHPTFLGVAAPQHRRTQEALSTEIYFGRLSRPLSNGLEILPLLNTDGKKLHVKRPFFSLPRFPGLSERCRRWDVFCGVSPAWFTVVAPACHFNGRKKNPNGILQSSENEFDC